MISQILEEHLEVVAGDTLDISLQLTDDEGVIIPEANLVGATAELQIRTKINDIEEFASIPAAIDDALAQVYFTVPALTTSLLLQTSKLKSTHLYGCKITYSDDSVATLVSGTITVIKGVVRE